MWLDDRGWVRVDPTAAVSPERIRDGIEQALPDAIIDIPAGLENNALARNIWRRLTYSLDAMNNRWNQWVLGYDNERQSRFLSQLGLKNINWGGMTGWLLGLLCLLALFITHVLWRSKNSNVDAARQEYERLCQKLAKLGITVYSTEGPRTMAQRVGQSRPDLAAELEAISSLYSRCRYAEQGQLLEELRLAVRNFRPPLNAAGR